MYTEDHFVVEKKNALITRACNSCHLTISTNLKKKYPQIKCG